MELEVYDNSVVYAHKQAECFASTLSCISIRDYGQDYGLSNDVAALDIDAWETDTSGCNDKTMDAAIGIANYIGNTPKSQRFLLVELRMNYTGQGANSRTSDMKAKSYHTRSLLSNCQVDGRSFFLFTKNVAPVVRNRISRESINDKSLLKWVITSPDVFVGLFHFIQDLPYQPESPIEDIRKVGKDLVSATSFDKAMKHLLYWLDEVKVYYDKYKHEECKALLAVIQDVFDDITIHKDEIVDDDANINYLIAKEEIEKFQKSIIFN